MGDKQDTLPHIIIEWKGNQIPFYVDLNTTWSYFKQLIELNLQVPIAHQKFIGIATPTQQQEYDPLSSLGLKDGDKIKLIGPTSEEIQQISEGTTDSSISWKQDQKSYDVIDIDDDDDDDDENNASTTQQSLISSTSSSSSYKPQIKLNELLALHEPSSPTPISLEKYFFDNKPFDEAFDACKREKRMLIAVVYCSVPSNHQSLQYCTEILTSNFVIELVKQNFIFWCCDTMNPNIYEQTQMLIRIAERNDKQLGNKFKNLSSESLPITVIASYGDNSMSLVEMIEGSLPAETLIVKLLNVLEIYGPLLESERLAVPKSASQTILSEQDKKYQEAVQKDLEIQKRKEKEAEEKKKREEEEMLEKSRISKLREEKKKKLLSEPEVNSTLPITTLRLRLLDGSQLERRFRTDTETIGNIFDFLFVEHHIHDLDNFELVSNFPKKSFTFQKDSSLSLRNANLSGQAQLFIKEK